MTHVSLLIIGAGPFGLSLAAEAQHQDIDYLVVGKPMHFWQSNMPQHMLLRSACDWHLDPNNIHTIEAYLDTMNLTPADVEPLSLDFYLSYTKWFQEQKQFRLLPELVERLDEYEGQFTVTMESGEQMTADHVALALGFKFFAHIPANLEAMLLVGRFGHTCDLVDLAAYTGKRVLIIGGRQSAFEWTALLHEEDAAAVHVCYRHDTPQFTEADWSWFNQKIDEMIDNPGWFNSLPSEEQAAINKRFWIEGRLKLEPWLLPRISHESVTLWPRTEMSACFEEPDGSLLVTLNNGETIHVDHVIFATGYQVDMARVPILARGNMMARLAVRNGYPELDERFETNIPGLFVTSMPAVQNFGLFFAFTISARTSAKLIGRAVENHL